MVMFRATVALALAAAFCVNSCNAVPSADVPTGHTPPPGTGGPIGPRGCGSKSLPPPVLGNCTDELSPSVPDLRGFWVGKVGGKEAKHWERIEQCGDRVGRSRATRYCEHRTPRLSPASPLSSLSSLLPLISPLPTSSLYSPRLDRLDQWLRRSRLSPRRRYRRQRRPRLQRGEVHSHQGCGSFQGQLQRAQAVWPHHCGHEVPQRGGQHGHRLGRAQGNARADKPERGVSTVRSAESGVEAMCARVVARLQYLARTDACSG